MTQHRNRGNGAETTGLKTKTRPVVDLPIDDLVHQVHHLGGKFGHGGRRAGVGVVTVIQDAKIGRGLPQIVGGLFWSLFGDILSGQ